MTNHLSWDTLNDLADDRLDPAEVRSATAHLEFCAECREAADGLRGTIRAVGELRHSIDPPAEVWSSIRQSIDASKVTTLPRDSARNAQWWALPRRLAVAAAVLVVASSGLTVLVMQRASSTGTQVVTAPERGSSLPIIWQAAEEGYLASVTELHDLLDAQRATLAPATVASVERSLATIDAAIVEARAALIDDPANAALADLLASNYRHKVEFLRRATQLDPRS